MTREKLHLATQAPVSIKGQTRPHSLLRRHVIAAALGIVTLAGCGDIYRYVTSSEVGWAIKKEIRDRRQTDISIARLTRFDWDEMIVFGAYTPIWEICRRLQLDEQTCKAANLPEPLNDGLSLLVFRRNGKIVHREIHLGYHGEFRVDDRISFTPDDARFVVEAKSTLSNGERQLILLRKASVSTSTLAKLPP